VELVRGDLLDASALREGCADARYVFHVAADYRLWVRDPAAMYRANVDGTLAVIDAAGAAGCERIVHCSSVAAVKPPEGPEPADENSEYADPQKIVSHYKKSKFLAEQAALARARSGLPVVVVNPAAPLGPYDIKPTPTGKIVADFLAGRIPSYIDTGLNVVHVQDVAQGHLLAALKGRSGQRYILGGDNLTLKQVLETLAEASGRAAPRFKTPYALAYAFGAIDPARARLFGGEPLAPLDAIRMARHYMWFSSRKAKEELGYRPRPARQALFDACRWFANTGKAASHA
ncbi:MAG: NAD-dependent epimerase/dehydratase family protein, partial [Elusimicrobia bacterium]|nr:NAD-dependent epimerase/dehydratase family protein [Elusimicrobiota bacterium]